ncbi:MAG: type II secretion system protein, partial [Limisphaerales bacterium]
SAKVTLPTAFLAGDRNLMTNGLPVSQGLLTVATNLALGWTKEMHNEQGYIAMADGSVQQMSSSRLKGAIRDQDIETNDLLIP